MKAALITVIESDKVNIDSNNTNYTRYFEKEAIQCFTHWRNNAGLLKDIDIYAVCITSNNVSDYTKRKFEELNVTYIEAYHNETENFDCGFYNKPLGCKYLESKLDHDYLIHIDLDMYLMNEPLIEWENSCMIYDARQQMKERVHNNESVVCPFNTCFMVTRRNDLIFAKWWAKLQEVDKQYRDNQDYFNLNYTNLEYRKLEELSFDLLSKDIHIHNIPNSLFGETYTDLNDISDDEFEYISFHHYHVYEGISEYNWLREWKKWKARLQ